MWDDAYIAAFKPERWLVLDPDTGKEVHVSLAGPSLAFDLGSRGCFGRKLEIKALRIQFAMIVWHFHLLGTPAELSSYDAVQRFVREPTQCFVRLASAIV